MKATKVEVGPATLYHGDSCEVLPLLEPVDAAVTDPPYGIGSWSSSGGNSLSPEEAAAINAWDVAPTRAFFDLLRSKSREQVIWGGNYFLDHLGSTRAPILWDKKNRGMHYADGEFAWTSFKNGTLRIFEVTLQGSEVRESGRFHPTQKPIHLLKMCIDKLPAPAATILDPFMGSGSTGVAAVQLGRRFVGIEREKKYFDYCVDRIRDAVSQGGGLFEI